MLKEGAPREDGGIRAAVYEGFRLCCWVRGCLCCCWFADVVGWVRAPVEGGTCLLADLPTLLPVPLPCSGGRLTGYYLLAGVTASGRGAARTRRGCLRSTPTGVSTRGWFVVMGPTCLACTLACYLPDRLTLLRDGRGHRSCRGRAPLSAHGPEPLTLATYTSPPYHPRDSDTLVCREV